MGKLTNKVALITGSTRGMGTAIAKLFAKEGAKVVVTGRDEKAGKSVVQEIKDAGGSAFFVKADISLPEANKRLVNETIAQFGQLDILVPNAGMLGLGSITEVDEKVWHQTLDTNLNAIFYLLRAAIPKMQQTDPTAAIVVTGSIAAHKGFPNHAAYCASKGAVESLVRQAAVDYAPDIRINMIQPGPVETKLYKDSAIAFPNADTILDEVPKSLPMQRTGAPDDIAQAVLFLASSDSSWMTGSIITIDGGASASG
ncbi:SDR family NAD(P)-dependent oxidoreductase [Fodinibius salsisoli]|uniref:SDR family oxidoreductase n=1 Tax=Fodinibius salsisoli TaxID=2820877 RepID=A0ABT3PJ88_9BACT|nr:SDR family oxidoreductase [Fodinibius salsisoli]MCW9706008.1 SDR family oxidoreductase [Fodinibius salsisoli]